MLLNELHGYKKYIGKSLKDILDDMRSSGKLRISAGAFAFVLKSDKSDYVYRVWTHDPAYEAWLEYVKANPSKYFIKTLGPVKTFRLLAADRKLPPFSDNNNEIIPGVSSFKYVKLEKLDSLSGIYHLIKGVFNTMVQLIKSKQGIRHLTVDQLAIDVQNHSDEVAQDVLDNGNFFKTYIQVTNDMIAKGYEFDIHQDNVMMRGLVPVITDPASDNNSVNGADGVSAPDLFDYLDSKMKRA